MTISIRQIDPGEYGTYGQVDPSYAVASILKVVPIDGGLRGVRFVEESVAAPYRKGADSLDDAPTTWPPPTESGEFAVFLADEEGRLVGGAAVIVDPSGAFLFERRKALAGLWDLRVAPDRRRNGIGSRLLLHAAEWARSRGCTQLRIESQNVNVAGCRFYARYCTLGGIERYAYAATDASDEVMLLWYRDLR